jgi:hypothetical protein
MKLSRRKFTGTLLLALGVGPALALESCNIVADLINYIPVVVSAINSISSILGAFMPLPAVVIINGIKGALADIQAACVEYQAAPDTDKATLWKRVLLFLHDVVDNFQKFLDALAVGGPILGVVLGIVNVILSTLGWFATQMPVPVAGGPIQMPMTLKAGNQTVSIMPVKRSIQQLKADLNRIYIAGGHPEQVMH